MRYWISRQMLHVKVSSVDTPRSRFKTWPPKPDAARVIATISSRGCRAPISIFAKKRRYCGIYTPCEGRKGTRCHPSGPQPIERERNISISRCGSPRTQRLAFKYVGMKFNPSTPLSCPGLFDLTIGTSGIRVGRVISREHAYIYIYTHMFFF